MEKQYIHTTEDEIALELDYRIGRQKKARKKQFLGSSYANVMELARSWRKIMKATIDRGEYGFTEYLSDNINGREVKYRIVDRNKMVELGYSQIRDLQQ